MNVKKFIVYVLIGISNISLIFAAGPQKEIEIVKQTWNTGLVKYTTTLSDGSNLTCDRFEGKKPSCAILKPGQNWQKTGWQNWYFLQELFEIQEKQALEEIEKFEKELADMKKMAKSEVELMESLRSKLVSDL